MVERVKARVRHGVEPVGRLLARTGLSPNALTALGCALNLGVGVVLGLGHLRAGGVLVLVVGAFDMLDGALARASGRASTFGAFFDSTLDRYSEAAVFMGLVAEGAFRSDSQVVLLSYAAGMGSLLVSYARARAEGLGLRGDVGWFQRPERIAVLGLGLALGLEVPALWARAVLTNHTALQRIHHVWRLTRR